MADKAAEEGNYKGVEKALWGGAFLFFAAYFALVFSGAYLGSSVISAFVSKIPPQIIAGFKVASGMLPALGIAILMQLLTNKKNAAYFFVGWTLTALLGVSTVGAALIGTIIAYVLYQNYLNKPVAAFASDNTISDDLEGEL
jgi:PTS system mannose-specific IIC component/fructoselysine and glucoselysine-specific PTS system IIC component